MNISQWCRFNTGGFKQEEQNGRAQGVVKMFAIKGVDLKPLVLNPRGSVHSHLNVP